jgi:hypothetical protein
MANDDAKARAQAVLTELRRLLPDKAAAIDALARKVSGTPRDGLGLRVQARCGLLVTERTFEDVKVAPCP